MSLYLQSVGDFRQLGDHLLLVDKLLPVQVTKLGAVETHTEIGAKHSLALLVHTENTCMISFTAP